MTKEFFEHLLRDFAPLFHQRSVKKGALLHRENEICLKLYFVGEGLLRSFYHVDGRDVTAHFAFQYGIIGAIDSILKNKPSRYNIEAIETSKLFVINYIELEDYLMRNPQFEKLARKVTQYLYLDLVERVEGMTFLTASDKYNHLIARYPDITNKVSLGHIATYLGISQETLSRVRSGQ